MVETSLNIDLNDPRSAKIAEVISNKTCKKILGLIAEKELTETEISSELKIPLNTVDYNIKKLVSVGLIETTNHFWSVKGKRMPSYRLSNKKIIISPKSLFAKKMSLMAIFGAGLVYFLGKYNHFRNSIITTPEPFQINDLALKSTEASVASSASFVSDQATEQVLRSSTSFFSSFNLFDISLLVIWLGIVIFLSYNYFKTTKFMQVPNKLVESKSNILKGGQKNE